MKKTSLRLFLTALLAVFGMQVMAGDWVPPTQPVGKAPVSGDTVMLYNVNTELYLASGKISANWESSTIVKETGLLFRLDETKTGEDESYWTITTASGGYAGKYVFAPTAEGDYPHCFVDMGGTWQGGYKWKLEELPNGAYTIQLTDHEMCIPGAYFGTDGSYNDVYFNIDPDENDEACIEWLFLTKELAEAYLVRIQLYEALNEAEGYGVSTAAAGAVYNDNAATLAELNKALNELKGAITAKQIGDDASEDNPVDITDLINNPNFDDDVSGWENLNGMTWIDAHYQNGDVEIDRFCEKWTWEGHLGEYGISQVLNLPKGHYRLEADAIATLQSNGSITVSGVKLYAKAENEFSAAVATANNAPQHYVVDFMVDGSTATEIGYHIAGTTEANWATVDNFKLYYLGVSEVSTSYFNLSNAVAAAEAAYNTEDFGYISANSTVKETYLIDFEAIKAVLDVKDSDDAVYDAALEQLNSAKATLDASVADYRKLSGLMTSTSALLEKVNDQHDELAMELDLYYDLIVGAYTDEEWGQEEINAAELQYKLFSAQFDLFTYCDERIEANGDDLDLCEIIENYQTQFEEAWHSSLYTSLEDVEKAKAGLEKAIADYQNNQIKPGDDLTKMLVNPDFATNSQGWNTNGANNPGWGDQCAEYYQTEFNISQKLQSMPKGHYVLTCQAFQRTGWGLSNYNNGDGSSVNTYLYANDQATKICHVGDFCSEDGYYVDPSGDNAYPYDSHDDGRGYYPNSMTGASHAFASSPETYLVKLDFFLTESEKNDLTIGLRGGKTDGGWWVLFDNFTLTYLGNNASDYFDAIEDLQQQIATIMSENTTTLELQSQVNDANTQAGKAIESNDADACIAVIPVLKEALAFAEETVKLTKQLSDEYGIITEYRMMGVVSSDTEFDAILSEVATAIVGSTLKDAQEVKDYMLKLKLGFTAYVQYDGLTTATEANPHDITAVIDNPDGLDILSGNYSTNGWDVTGNYTANSFGTEFYQNDFSFTQTLYGLAPGYYKLHVQAYYRPGWPGQNIEDPTNYVTLFACEDQCNLLTIYADAQDYEPGSECTVYAGADDQPMYIPNSMDAGATFFALDLYKNTLVFHVEEGQVEVVIGMMKNSTLTGDWVMFDNWSLEYVGTAKPEEESTAVESIKLADVVAENIFTVDGRQLSRLQKGINLVKRTDSNGRTKVSKIIVK